MSNRALHAVAEAVNSIGRQRADDDVSDRAPVLHIEHRRLAFALAAAGQVITSIAAVENFTRSDDASRRELHRLGGSRHGTARIEA